MGLAVLAAIVSLLGLAGMVFYYLTHRPPDLGFVACITIMIAAGLASAGCHGFSRGLYRPQQ